MIFILTHSHLAAVQLAARLNLHTSAWSWLNRPEKLLGERQPRVLATSTWGRGFYPGARAQMHQMLAVTDALVEVWDEG